MFHRLLWLLPAVFHLEPPHNLPNEKTKNMTLCSVDSLMLVVFFNFHGFGQLNSVQDKYIFGQWSNQYDYQIDYFDEHMISCLYSTSKSMKIGVQHIQMIHVPQ